MLSLIIFFLVLIIGSPIGMSMWQTHALSCLFALANLKNLSRFYIFWVLLIITYFFATNPRLSLEYLLLAAGLMSFGMSKLWLNLESQKRFYILLSVFLLISISDLLKYSFSELGSLLMWLAVFLIISVKLDPRLSLKLQRKFLGLSLGTFIYLAFLIMLFFSNKKINLLAQLLSFKEYLNSRFVYLLGFITITFSFLFKEKIYHFLQTSIKPRLAIWQSVLNAFVEKPLFGHGFGSFVLDFPPYRHLAQGLGSHGGEQINHAHNLFLHYSFELGILGLILVASLFYLVATRVPEAISCLALVSIADSNLQSFNQFLLMGLIVLPLAYIPNPSTSFLLLKNCSNFLFKKIENPLLMRLAFISLFCICSYSFFFSLVGHYHYDRDDLDKAIKYDSMHPLYYLVRGLDKLSEDVKLSEKDLLNAVKYAPRVPYMHGCLAAVQLANNHHAEAKQSIDFAIKHSADDGYWFILAALAHQPSNPALSKEFYQRAVKTDPYLETFLKDPELASYKVIGGKSSDSRVKAFYRTGKKIYLPLPVIK